MACTSAALLVVEMGGTTVDEWVGQRAAWMAATRVVAKDAPEAAWTVAMMAALKATKMAVTMAGLMADTKGHCVVATKAASRVVLLVGKWVGKLADM